MFSMLALVVTNGSSIPSILISPINSGWESTKLETVDGYLECSDFFTLDVADWIGQPASDETVSSFVDSHPELIGKIKIEGIDEPFVTTRASIENIAAKYLSAVAQAGEIYRKIESAKGEGSFITEVSMDETDSPQTPPELLVILAALSDQGVPAQTIAPDRKSVV